MSSRPRTRSTMRQTGTSRERPGVGDLAGASQIKRVATRPQSGPCRKSDEETEDSLAGCDRTNRNPGNPESLGEDSSVKLQCRYGPSSVSHMRDTNSEPPMLNPVINAQTRSDPRNEPPEESLQENSPNERLVEHLAAPFSPSCQESNGSQFESGREKILRSRAANKQGIQLDFVCSVCMTFLPPLTVWITCAQCTNVHLCVSCFTGGRQTREHLASHSYLVNGYNRMPLYDPVWTADEELLLLDGITRHGVGNWPDIALLVNKSSDQRLKTPAAAESHYYEVYVQKKYLQPSSEPRELETPPEERPVEGNIAQLWNLTLPRDPSCDWISDESEWSRGQVREYFVAASRGIKSDTESSANQLIGYSVNRGDFDQEHDDRCEMLLADMPISATDPPDATWVKLQIIELYNSRLDERVYRKRLVLNREWFDGKQFKQNFLVMVGNRKKPRKQQDLRKTLNLVLLKLRRYHTDTQHELLLKLLECQNELVQRRAKLQEWSSLGLQTVAQIKEYEFEKNRRQTLYQNLSYADQRHANHSVERKGSLSLLEYEFCKEMNFPISFYLLMRNALLRQASENPSINSELMRKKIACDENTPSEMWDFDVVMDFERMSEEEKQSLCSAAVDEKPVHRNSRIFSTDQAKVDHSMSFARRSGLQRLGYGGHNLPPSFPPSGDSPVQGDNYGPDSLQDFLGSTALLPDTFNDGVPYFQSFYSRHDADPYPGPPAALNPPAAAPRHSVPEWPPNLVELPLNQENYYAV